MGKSILLKLLEAKILTLVLQEIILANIFAKLFKQTKQCKWYLHCNVYM